MNSRLLLPLVLTVPAAAFESAGWMLTTSNVGRLLEQEGMPFRSLGTFFIGFSLVCFLGIIAAGLVAFAVSPRLIAVFGVALSALGCLGVFFHAPTHACLYLIAFGGGVFRPCPWVIGAELLTADDDSAFSGSTQHQLVRLAAYFFGLEAASGLLSTFATPALQMLGRDDVRFFFVATAVAFAVATLLLAVAAVDRAGRAEHPSRKRNPYRRPAEADRPSPTPLYRRNPSYAEGVLLLALPVGLNALSSMLSLGRYYELNTVWLFSVSPIAHVVSSIVLLLVFVASPPRGSPLLILAIGLCLTALGQLPVALVAKPSVELAALAVALSAAGASVIWPIATAYAALATRTRARTLVLAGWVLVPGIVSHITPAITHGEPGGVLLTLVAFAAGGVLLAAFAERWQRAFFAPVPQPASAQPIA